MTAQLGGIAFLQSSRRAELHVTIDGSWLSPALGRTTAKGRSRAGCWGEHCKPWLGSELGPWPGLSRLGWICAGSNRSWSCSGGARFLLGVCCSGRKKSKCCRSGVRASHSSWHRRALFALIGVEAIKRLPLLSLGVFPA